MAQGPVSTANLSCGSPKFSSVLTAVEPLNTHRNRSGRMWSTTPPFALHDTMPPPPNCLPYCPASPTSEGFPPRLHCTGDDHFASAPAPWNGVRLPPFTALEKSAY